MTNDHEASGASGAVVARLGRIAASPWTAGLAIALILFVVVLTSLQRTNFNMGVETDFTGRFAIDAMRILEGEALESRYHPPGFPFAAALARALSGSWLAGGLWISGISALIVVTAGFVTARRLFGVAASWGVLIACACSTAFLVYASTVSSDMLFAAVATIMLAFVVAAIIDPSRAGLWFFGGMAASCVMLTRANGLAIAVAFLAPLFVSARWGNRLRWLGVMALGFAIPQLLWILYAITTDSPITASGNYLNLAYAAYGDESKSWNDEFPRLNAQFTGLVDVLTHDPMQLAARLSKRMILLPVHLIRELTWPPLTVLAAAGVVWVLFRKRTPASLAYFVIATSLALLAAIASPKPRLFLFLLPAIGALSLLAFNEALGRLFRKDLPKAVAYGVATCIIALVAVRAHAPVISQVEPFSLLETAEAIPEVRRVTEPNAMIYARKSGLAFGAGRMPRQLPDVENLSALRRHLCAKLVPGQTAYLFIGYAERRYRARVATELSAAKQVSWLQLVARGAKTEWGLYRILLVEPGRCA